MLISWCCGKLLELERDKEIQSVLLERHTEDWKCARFHRLLCCLLKSSCLNGISHPHWVKIWHQSTTVKSINAPNKNSKFFLLHLLYQYTHIEKKMDINYCKKQCLGYDNDNDFISRQNCKRYSITNINLCLLRYSDWILFKGTKTKLKNNVFRVWQRSGNLGSGVCPFNTIILKSLLTWSGTTCWLHLWAKLIS